MVSASKQLYIVLWSTLLLAGTDLAWGATLRNAEEAKELAEKALSRLVVGDIERAFAVVKPYWSLPEDELEALSVRAVQQRAHMTGRLGKSLGFVLVRRETLTDVFLRLTYVEKREHAGLFWLFTFYKARDAWRLQHLTWEENISKLPSSGH